MDDSLRISDNERLTAMSSLAGHYTEGRLDDEEFDERSLAVSRARTRGDLRPLFADLPGQIDAALSPERLHGVVEKRSGDADLDVVRSKGRRIEALDGVIVGVTLVAYLVLQFVAGVTWAWVVWPSLLLTLAVPRLIHNFSDGDEKAYEELKRQEELDRKERIRRAARRMDELEK